MDIEAKVLKSVSPTKAEEKRVYEFSEKLKSVSVSITKLPVEILGSTGKKTWLSGDHDIDVFIIFSKNVEREQLETRGIEFGKKIIEKMGSRPIIKYAEHPYVRSEIDGFDVDIVPCHKINFNEKIKSAVDRSPLHVQYINSKLDPSLRDQVRLLKQFMKGTGVYGSDAKNLGFSGYLCELLVINHGKFEAVIKKASEWQAQTVIYIEKKPVKKFKGCGLVIIDPVDSDRNAAAIVSNEKMQKFITACKRYMKNPSIEFFFPRDKPALIDKEISVLKNRETKFIALELKKPDIIDDIIYPQARRLCKRLEGILRQEDFLTVRILSFINKNIIILIELESWHLPAIKKMQGPTIFSGNHVDEFVSKYYEFNPYIEDNAWFVERPRTVVDVIETLKNLRKSKNPAEHGIPSQLIDSVKEMKIIESDKFWELAEKDKEFSKFLRSVYFERIV